jgi:hypothetical protein
MPDCRSVHFSSQINESSCTCTNDETCGLQLTVTFFRHLEQPVNTDRSIRHVLAINYIISRTCVGACMSSSTWRAIMRTPCMHWCNHMHDGLLLDTMQACMASPVCLHKPMDYSQYYYISNSMHWSLATRLQLTLTVTDTLCRADQR